MTIEKYNAEMSDVEILEIKDLDTATEVTLAEWCFVGCGNHKEIVFKWSIVNNKPTLRYIVYLNGRPVCDTETMQDAISRYNLPLCKFKI